MDIILALEQNFSIKLSAESKDLIKKAINILIKANDPINGLPHSENLIEYLKKYRQFVKNDLNIETVLLAIFWHDIWKVKNVKKNVLSAIHGLFFEGYRANKLFLEAALEANLPKGLTNKASHVIKEHSAFVFWRTSLESKFFHDIDQIDSENSERLEKQKEILADKPLLRFLYYLQKFYPKFFYFKEIYQLNKSGK